MVEIRVVFISVPRDEASALAKALVKERLCACVNIAPRIESYYWWDGEVNFDEESLLIAKTTRDRFPDLQDYVRENHPYDLPEVISVSLADGLPDYVAWVKKETGEQG